jgi:hypothetical protein
MFNLIETSYLITVMISFLRLNSTFSLRAIFCQMGLSLTTLLAPNPSLAADKITFIYPPFGQFDIQIADLATFAQTGEVPGRTHLKAVQLKEHYRWMDKGK